MGGKQWGISFLMIDHQEHSGFVTLCSCQTMWIWLGWLGQVKISEHEAACIWARFSRKLSLQPIVHWPTAPHTALVAYCPSCSSHFPLHCPQESKNNMGKVYGPFQALMLQLPRMLVLENGRTWVWSGEATGAAVVFIAVLIRVPTSICRHSNRNRDSCCQLWKSHVAGDYVVGLKMKEETDLFSLFITAIQSNLFKVTISHSKRKCKH